ncbi:MAG: hypothetical protein NOU37_08730 [Candidatus Brocadiales bacterium]|nr:hypothetical protein [Candidatus Bathyanammoxibius amoris]
MTFDKQLSVVLENLPGTMAGVCASLVDAGVNVLALVIADMCDTGELRIIVDNWQRAKAVLEEDGYDVLVSEVLVAEMTSMPGAMAEIAQKLAKGNVNIEYAYYGIIEDEETKKGKIKGVIKVSDSAKALDILGE